MPQYILMLHEPAEGLPAGLSPEEIQGIIERYKAWRESLGARGFLAGGEKLRDGEGRVLRRAGGRVTVTDGPYTEAKEVIGGFFTLQCASYEQAMELANDCPHLEFGAIEIREVEPV